MINLSVELAAFGRFKLIKHTGHKFNEAGEIVQHGRILHETPFSDNVFTNAGRAAYLSGSNVPLTARIGTSSTPPNTGGVSPGSIRSTTTLVSVATSRRNVVDVNGQIYWRTTYQFTFPIGGAGIIAYKQAAIWSPAFGYLSGSLLKDQKGIPTQVSVNHADETLDLVWEFNEYIPAEQRGSIIAQYTKGGGVIATTAHNWILRPANFTNVDDTDKGWRAIETAVLPNSPIDVDFIKAGSGTLGFLETQPTFDEAFNPETAGSFYGVWGFEAVAVDGFNIAQFMFGHSEWQISFDPPIAKTLRHDLKITLNLNITNRG